MRVSNSSFRRTKRRRKRKQKTAVASPNASGSRWPLSLVVVLSTILRAPAITVIVAVAVVSCLCLCVQCFLLLPGCEVWGREPGHRSVWPREFFMGYGGAYQFLCSNLQLLSIVTVMQRGLLQSRSAGTRLVSRSRNAACWRDSECCTGLFITRRGRKVSRVCIHVSAGFGILQTVFGSSYVFRGNCWPGN